METTLPLDHLMRPLPHLMLSIGIGTLGRRRHRRTRAWPGVSVTFVIEAHVQSSVGTITNTATLASSTFDPVAANNTNAATLVMQGGTGRKPRCRGGA